jgi:peptidyl-prolyl cis-trans isomerase SurA
VKLNFVDTMRTKLVISTMRRPLGSIALVITAVAISAGVAAAQVQVPKYQGPIEAPRPQTTLPAPAPITPNGQVVEYPIVRVNDQIIDRSDYEHAEAQLLEDAQRENLTPAELEQQRKDLLRDMIDQQLLLSRGKELEINPDSDVVRQLDDIRKQNHFDTMEDLEKAVRQSGVSYEDFKANIRNKIITSQVVRDEVGRNLHISARTVQTYYDQHKQDFAQPEQVRLSEILVPTPEQPTDTQLAQAQAKADDVEAKLKAGAKFDDLVKQYPDSPNADAGGDLGTFRKGEGKLAKLLEDQTFVLQAGQSTSPIRTRQGFVILKVTEHTPAGVPPLSAVDEQVQNAMYQEQIQPALRVYLTGLREKAYVDIAPGFTDTGASPKQTKPIYASTTPPVVKNKGKKARLDSNHSAAAVASNSSAPVSTGALPSSASAGKTTATPGRSKAATSSTRTVGATTVATKGKKSKVHREKIRYGQAPRNSLPAGPEETLAAGADQGPGSASSLLPAPGAAIASIDQSTTSTDADPLAPKAVSNGKTRYSDRAPVDVKAKKVAAKTAKVQQKAAAAPAPLTADQKAAQQVQEAPLGLSGDTATKTKKNRVKGAPKERIQEAPPAPPAPKPEATPIPPKSVRDNGEPVVSPPPANLPPPADSQPTAPTSPAPQ